ncbi:MAG: hypothetical protein JWL73_2737 [Actinomycetia bacterium]|nr:hypothetical protein [Actinomycetes bacterium]
MTRHPLVPDPARIGVVVITMNRRAELLRTLAELADFDPRPPVVVLDNGSVDGTADSVRHEVPWVELIALPHNRGAAARNIGVRRLRTDYVAFCDDDMPWQRGSLDRAVDVLDDYPWVAVLAAKVLVGPGDREDPVCRQMREGGLLAARPTPGPRVLGFLAGAVVVRRRAFLAAGGFTERFGIGGEEDLLAWDLDATGWDLVYDDRLAVRHHPSEVRDSASRAIREHRNRLWAAWMRRRPGHALRETATAFRRALTDPTERRALVAAVGGLVWALRNRQRIPDVLEAELAALERRW